MKGKTMKAEKVLYIVFDESYSDGGTLPVAFSSPREVLQWSDGEDVTAYVYHFKKAVRMESGTPVVRDLG